MKLSELFYKVGRLSHGIIRVNKKAIYVRLRTSTVLLLIYKITKPAADYITSEAPRQLLYEDERGVWYWFIIDNGTPWDTVIV
jgi:hypothetical protein